MSCTRARRRGTSAVLLIPQHLVLSAHSETRREYTTTHDVLHHLALTTVTRSEHTHDCFQDRLVTTLRCERPNAVVDGDVGQRQQVARGVDVACLQRVVQRGVTCDVGGVDVDGGVADEPPQDLSGTVAPTSRADTRGVTPPPHRYVSSEACLLAQRREHREAARQRQLQGVGEGGDTEAVDCVDITDVGVDVRRIPSSNR
jgi:hypothetical protein